MPISRSDFESAGDVIASIMNFLRDNRDLAFTVQELRGEFSQMGVNLEEEHLRAILKDLERRGRVESKVVSGLVYYVYKAQIGFRSSQE